MQVSLLKLLVLRPLQAVLQPTNNPTAVSDLTDVIPVTAACSVMCGSIYGLTCSLMHM